MCLRYHIHLLQTIFFSLKNLNASLISLRAFAHALPLVFLANHITDLPHCKLWIRNIYRNISDACSTLFFCNKPCVLIICQYIYKGLHLLTSHGIPHNKCAQMAGLPPSIQTCLSILQFHLLSPIYLLLSLTTVE